MALTDACVLMSREIKPCAVRIVLRFIKYEDSSEKLFDRALTREYC